MTVLRFYKDGPIAIVGCSFWTAYHGTLSYRKGIFPCGCTVADNAGAKIPRSTYLPGANADEPLDDEGVYVGGGRRTAILPLEFDE